MLKLDELLRRVKVDTSVVLLHDDTVAEFQIATYGKEISDSVGYYNHGVSLLVVYELLICAEEAAAQGAPVGSTGSAALETTNWSVILSHVC